MHHPLRVLFVCDGGSSRSWMAEVLLQSLSGKEFAVHSAGLEPEAVHPLAVKVMEEIGIPVTEKTVKHIDDYEEIQFDYVIALCEQATESCLAFPRDIENLHWECPNPLDVPGTEETQLAAFRAVRELLRKRIEAWLPEAISKGGQA